jgi:5-hydroxyisourate hydrolase
VSADPRRLTCHVLDVTVGRPAAGLAVRLERLDGPDAGPVGSVRTNADGRTDEPLLAGDAMVPGRYELTFAVGDHFATTLGAADPAGRYLDDVPVRFRIGPGAAHLHVALLVTPFSYSTYRGS